MKMFLRQLKLRRRSERGAAMIVVAIAMSVVIPTAGAMTVDLGIITSTNRSLQSIADAGALNAASYLNEDPSYVTTAAENAATDNGWASAVTGSNVVEGNSMSGGNVTSGTCPCSYVQVTAASTMNDLFVYGQQSLSRTAIAQVTPSEDGFSVGSYLADFNSSQASALNSLFSSTGTSFNIQAAGYDGLASANLTIQSLLTAADTVISPSTTLTTSNFLTTRLTDAQWSDIISKALAATSGLPVSCSGSFTPDPCIPTSSLSAWITGVTSSLPAQGACTSITNPCLGQLVSVNGSTSGTLSVSQLDASVSALQIFSTELETANGSSGISLASALGLGGNVAKLTFTAIQPAQVAYGPVGAVAKTSQISFGLNLAGLVTISATGVDGQATFDSMTCSNSNSSNLDEMTSTVFDATTTVGTLSNIAITGANDPTLTFTQSYPTPPLLPQTKYISTSGLGVSGLGPLSTILSLLGLSTSTLTSSIFSDLQALGITVNGAAINDLTAVCGSVSLVR
jgi:uncharacterized membrane protein